MYRARFLLAQLHMDSLRDKTSIKLIKKALETLPIGSKALDLAYDGAMRRVGDQLEGFRLYAIQLLGWLTYSKRLMTLKELQQALAIEPGTTAFDADNIFDIDEVVSFCAGLVIVDEQTKTIRLVHYTTQEYFRRNGDHLLASAKQEIAINCLTYLSYDEFEDGWVEDIDRDEDQDHDDDDDRNQYFDDFDGSKKINNKFLNERGRKYPFLAYASRHWADHVKLCDQQNVEELFVSFTKDDRKISNASQIVFTKDGEKLSCWRELQRTNSQNPLTAMHMLAYLGCQELISKLLACGLNADAEDFCQRTPLWWAALQGHQAVVKLLLSQGHVNVNSRGVLYSNLLPFSPVILPLIYTPLAIAVRGGHDKIVELLVEREDVDVNLIVGEADAPWIFPISKEFSIFRDLLKRKVIDVNTKNYDGKVSPRHAAGNGDVDIVKLLLNMEAIIQGNLRNDNGFSPLNLASKWSQERVVKALLSRADIEIDSRDVNERTPLMNAAGNGHQAVVELLLSHPNIEVNLTDSNGKNALNFAIKREAILNVELLKSRSNLDVNLRDSDGRTALHLALTRGSIKIVELLLSRSDTDVNQKDRFGRNAFQLAPKRGSIKMLKLLMSRSDIDLNARDNTGSTLLFESAKHGRFGMVELLLERTDVDVNSKDKQSRTPLLIAAQRGQLNTVRKLLSCVHIDVNSKDDDGMTPLAHAVMTGFPNVVELLCAHQDIDMNPTDKTNRDVLALVREREEVIPKFDKASRAMICSRLAKCLKILHTARETRS